MQKVQQKNELSFLRVFNGMCICSHIAQTKGEKYLPIGSWVGDPALLLRPESSRDRVWWRCSHYFIM